MYLGHTVHFTKHIHIIIGCAAVGADTDAHPGGQHGRHRRYARGKFHVRFRAMGDFDPTLCQQVDLLVIKDHAMGGQGPVVKQAEFIKMAEGSCPEPLPAQVDLIPVLGHMNMDQGLPVPGKTPEPGQQVGRAGVDRVRVHGHGDQVMVRIVGKQLFHEGKAVFQFPVARRGEIIEHLSQPGPHT